MREGSDAAADTCGARAGEYGNKAMRVLPSRRPVAPRPVSLSTNLDGWRHLCPPYQHRGEVPLAHDHRVPGDVPLW